ncbi:L,D-transpeptidase [Nocardia sp. GCM10030253]|uniref:L,D-transpeptidase family protein n=1 Tax=Nocardia sp. GCM10030253 TaxID=3273404 RepID=UPI003645E73A
MVTTRTRLRVGCAAAVFAAVYIGGGGAQVPPRQLPLPYDGDANQVVTVVADHSGATTATLTAWERLHGGWRAVIGPVPARVGAEGIGNANENSSRTPAGTWTITEVFGLETADDALLPYRRVGTSDWWVSDVHSRHYNTHVHCDRGSCPFDETASENLGEIGPIYNHAIVIDYNRAPVIPGAGSAFFLHATNGQPTAGCVAIPAADLPTLLRWLDPAEHPVIDIGVVMR